MNILQMFCYCFFEESIYNSNKTIDIHKKQILILMNQIFCCSIWRQTNHQSSCSTSVGNQLDASIVEELLVQPLLVGIKVLISCHVRQYPDS